MIGGFVKREIGLWIWEFRYRDSSNPGRPQRQITLSAARYPKETQARTAVEGLLMKINADDPLRVIADPTFGALIDRFSEEERLVELSKQKPGVADDNGLHYGTACAYRTILNRHIRPKWGEIPLSQMRPAAVQEWPRQMNAAPKYKAKIKASCIASTRRRCCGT